MTRALGAFLLLTALLAPAPVAAQAARQLRSGEAVATRGATAYLLFRTDPRVMEDWFEFVFVREAGAPRGPADPPVLAASHVEAGRNLIKTEAGRVYATSADSRIFLLAVPPGSYFLAAVGYKQLRAIGTCL
ncbi:MAG TPA: hypothetical protein VF535_07175, partial [Allosphingosinicella sp.]